MVITASATGSPTFSELQNLNSSVFVKRDRYSIQKIVCEPSIFRYEKEVAEYEARVILVWNHKHVVDWTNLTIYKCSILGSHRKHQDCSLCVTRPSKYQCAWCSGACKFFPSCPGNALALMQTDEDDDGSKNTSESVRHCPMPRIDVVSTLFYFNLFICEYHRQNYFCAYW